MAIDMGSITAVSGSLQAAVEIVRAMVRLRDATAIQGKVAELQGAILDAQASALTAQQDQFTLMQRVRELEDELARMETWSTEKEKYQLTQVFPEAFAYTLKPERGIDEPPHWLCTTCFENRRRSYLQRAGPPPKGPQRYRVFRCVTCGNEILVDGSVTPDHPYQPVTTL